MCEEKVVGCNMDSCPLGKGSLCCFECGNIEECKSTKKICDLLVILETDNLTQYECEFYHTSTEKVTEEES